MSIKIEDILIVGAGLTGLTIGRALKELGKDCLIVEKSRGLGGRVATRRIDNLGLDHGAPFLKVVPGFEDSLKTFFDSLRGQAFFGGMNQLAKIYAKDLRILKEQRVTRIHRENNLWKISTEEGMEVLCRSLIITAPLPQACELLDQNHLLPLDSPLKSIQYSKALIYLGVFENIPEEFFSQEIGGHRFHLMRERGLHPQGLVLEISAADSEKLFNESDENILIFMRTLIRNSPFKKLSIRKEELKKWRYSQPLKTFSESFFEVGPGLYLTGDGFNGALQLSNNLVQVL